MALTQLLTRVYGPIAQLSNVQISVMTALVSFDRVFEVLDLKPLITEKPDAVVLPARVRSPDGGSVAPEIEFDDVSFRYPSASEVSLASLMGRRTAPRPARLPPRRRPCRAPSAAGGEGQGLSRQFVVRGLTRRPLPGATGGPGDRSASWRPP